MNKKDIKKVVLAYSGGLDTSIIIPWLKENYNNCEVIAVSGDVGQGTELDGLEEKALATGASKLYILDLKEEYVEDYIFPCLKAGAEYENYLLGTSHARPCIAKALAEVAKKEGADAICHGCTGKGNDQVRFELTLKAFAPEMEIIAPWREWDIVSREQEIEYAEAHNIPLKINRETNYSKDKNVWHLSHEGLDLEDPANEPQYNKDGFLELSVSPENAPDEPTYITIHFDKGVPTAIDGKKMGALEVVETLNEVGGKNGIGLLDIVENRLVGMKSRGVYETPGGEILYKAHEMLETITLDKETQHYKKLIAQKFGELVYNGQWFTPLREALSAFVDETQKTVTGDVKVKLYKGNVINAGITSPYTLYDENVASFGDDGGAYNQADAAGFINLFGLSIKVKALLDQNRDNA
ncbi:argininosuccinate synthase [Eubacterium coprostanoligenes]|uniref:argininosuccinate synthase n=1 Tax=Eubacterium coprostanoligenes TaxID=290054 RepID=UPI002A813D11|nr:argininosuccinate synthase [Eubacterium coprostanoligenes]MDY4698562.1 argininosuccinate synthase [Eubacterium coprostanoligenes]